MLGFCATAETHQGIYRNELTLSAQLPCGVKMLMGVCNLECLRRVRCQLSPGLLE